MRRTPTTLLGGTLAALLALSLGATAPVGAATGPTQVRSADGRGTWRVTPRADDTYLIAWRSPQRLPVTDARPEITLGGRVLGPARLAGDGRTVSVTSGIAPDVARLDVVLSGRVLDKAQPSASPSAPAPRLAAVPNQNPLLDVDPGVRGELEITSSDYRLPGLKLPRMAQPVEVVGHVVRPADPSLAPDAPLVLFLHGRHSFCYDPDRSGDDESRWPCGNGTLPVPSQLGYEYVQRRLATQGFVTVSIAANGINAQDFEVADGGAGARARLIRRHLEQWAAWAADGTFDVDMQNVVLVGHSRGGEGVNRASLQTPLDGAPYRITGQVLLAPTDFARQTTAYLPTVTMLPYCDGDVIDLQGQAYTDLARDLSVDDTSLKSSVLVMGANHNFFNSEWTPRISAAPSFDDFGGGPERTCGRGSPGRLTAKEQRQVGRTYIAGAVRLLAGTSQDVLPMFDGSRVRVASAGDADVRTTAIGAGRQLVRPGLDASAAPSVGATGRICAGLSETEGEDACGRGLSSIKTPHWVTGTLPGIPTRDAFEMTWTAEGQRAGLALDAPLDAASARFLDLRTIVDPKVGNVRLRVRLVDADGHEATVTPEDSGRLRALPRGSDFFLGKLLAQNLRVPLAGVTGVDLARITQVDLVGAGPDGHVWVLDIAAVRPGPLPAVPDKRLPTLDLGRVRQVEGDQDGPAVLDVPFRLSAPSTETARFVVTGNTLFGRPLRAARQVDVAPGQTTGTIRFRYTPNRIDDLRARGFALIAFAERNLMTRRYLNTALILDDDPRPRVTLQRTPARRAEGGPLTWTLRLSEPVGYPFFVAARAVPGPAASAPRLQVGDLREGFRARHGLRRASDETPLFRAGLFLGRLVRPGTTTVQLKVPVRRDGVREPTESLTLRVDARPLLRRHDATIRVHDLRP